MNDVAEGFGIFFHNDGDYYEGEWMNGMANGHGKYVHTNGG